MVFPVQATFCPVCKQRTAITLESRSNKDSSRRRRKECTECKHRFTTHEVSEEFYKTAITNKKALDTIMKCLNLNEVSLTNNEPNDYDCSDCVHMRSFGCGFDFPDAGGDFANECSMFELDKR